MKKILILLLFTLVLTQTNGQKFTLDKAVIRDFSVSFFYKYKYENNQNLRAWAYLTGNKLGYGRVDIEIAVEQMESNQKFREELFRTFASFSNYNEEFLVLNLISIGMQATNAKKLGMYILRQYKVDTPVEIKEKTIANDKPVKYIKVDKDAQFFGGDAAYSKYIRENLIYPDSALNNEISGIVEIEFTIDKDGSIINVHVIEGEELGYGIPEEALRVIKAMPKWEPAMMQGKPLKSIRRQKLNFQAPVNGNNGTDKISPVDLKPKAVFPRTEAKTEKVNNQVVVKPAFVTVKPVLFTGAKTFCDAEKMCKYEVTIKNDSITLKLFPGSNNNHYKNKSKQIEVIKGLVANGKIVTKDAPEFLTNRFKYEKGVLYEVNNEGDYNDYPECK